MTFRVATIRRSIFRYFASPKNFSNEKRLTVSRRFASRKRKDFCNRRLLFMKSVTYCRTRDANRPTGRPPPFPLISKRFKAMTRGEIKALRFCDASRRENVRRFSLQKIFGGAKYSQNGAANRRDAKRPPTRGDGRTGRTPEKTVRLRLLFLDSGTESSFTC